nr:hypothetical protein [Tanacetum cinerariifolium]
MITRLSAINLFPPLDNPELAIQRRSRIDPTVLNNSKMAAEGPDDLPVPDFRIIEKLCQPSLNGQGGPIGLIAIQEMNFGLKNDMIQHSIKVNGVTDDVLHLYLFPHSLTHHATAWIINEITNFRQHPNESLFEVWERYNLSIDRSAISNTQGNRNLLSYHSDNYLGPPGFNQNQNFNNQNKNFHNQNRNQENHNPQGNNQGRNQFFQGANQGQNQPPAYQALVYQAPANDAILKNMQTNMTSLTNSNLELKNMFSQFIKMNTASSSGSGTLPCNTIINPKEDLKGITTRSGTAYQGPTIPITFSSLIVERETEVTKDTLHPTNNGSTKDVQPPVVPTESLILNSEPVISPIIEPVASSVSALKPNLRPSIPYPSRLHDQKLCDKANDQQEIFSKSLKI